MVCSSGKLSLMIWKNDVKLTLGGWTFFLEAHAHSLRIGAWLYSLTASSLGNLPPCVGPPALAWAGLGPAGSLASPSPPVPLEGVVSHLAATEGHCGGVPGSCISQHTAGMHLTLEPFAVGSHPVILFSRLLFLVPNYFSRRENGVD